VNIDMMNSFSAQFASIVATFCLAATPQAADAESSGRPPVSPQTLEEIRAAAMSSNWAWEQLAHLTDTIGPRLSGSPGLGAAIVQVGDAARSLGARVTIQKVAVPHWVRGEEEAQLLDYPGRPAGVTQALHITALGGSAATPREGLTADIIVVRDVEDLQTRAADVPGKVVLFEARFDQRLAKNGYGIQSYEWAGKTRFFGPSIAQSLGARAVLVRSIGGADYRLPHTGGTEWSRQPHIPAAAIAAEDADLIARLAASGRVTARILLTPQTLPDAESANVIADWPGRELPKEYVLVSGHLDSWDLGTGATDDGVGVISAAAVIEVLNRLQLHPRRTIRFVAWTNEENGSRGSEAYAKSVAGAMQTQFAAIESDLGAGAVLGISAAVTPESLVRLQPVVRALAPIGATVLQRTDGELGSDIGELQRAGVPGFAPLLDTRHYFDYHHTAADTLDKVDPENLKSQVAALAVLAYYLAEMPDTLPRFKTQAGL
jgi:carboxypeptidase Q